MRAVRRGAFVLALALGVLGPRGAWAAAFNAAIDRDAVAPGEPFTYELTLSLADESVESFRPPDFRALKVVEAPRFPSRSTNMQIVGGQTSIQNSLVWTFQLMVPPGAKGPFTIGAAHVRVGGKDLASNGLSVRVGASNGPPRPRPGAAGPAGPFGRMFPGNPFGDESEAAPVSSSASAAFIRVIPDKTRVFVGEQVTVGWYLYLTQNQNRYETISEPHTDGFWSEDIPSTNPQGRLSFTEQSLGGQTYNVALLFKKALFPLAPGKLIVTPMEAQVSQVDFFGQAVRAKRLKTDPLVIETLPLPHEGMPPHFDPSNVGHYELSAGVDRSTVTVGDAVTLKVAVKGTGNVRNVQPPALPALTGWKSYEPKTDVAVDGAETISGTKTVEWLLRPERPGKTTVPPLVLETFDPGQKRYQTVRTRPFDIVVTGEAGATTAAPGAGGPPPAGVENVVSGTIRPIRGRGGLGGESGVAFLHSAAFTATVVTPPLALALFALFGRVRARLDRDEGRTRRRRMRSMARRRLRAAEAHRAAGQAGPFYVEIDRVLRGALSERLGAEVGGLRLDELGALLRARGLPDAEAAAVIGALESCDEARFAPGTSANPNALADMLARAEQLIDAIERAPFGGGAKA
ncbi:MAG TPA: BatD family protein [Polyangia bacterium]|nr:BatD family protein [Polyangia bacterium]